MDTYSKLDNDNMVIYNDSGEVDKVVTISKLSEEKEILTNEVNQFNTRINEIDSLLLEWEELE